MTSKRIYRPIWAACGIVVLGGAFYLSPARAETQNFRICISDTESRCEGTYSDFYKTRRGAKNDVNRATGETFCKTARGHLLSVDGDDAKEAHGSYTLVTIACEIDPVSAPPPRDR